MTSILILQHQRPDGEVDTYHLKAGRRYHLGRGSQCQVRVLDLKLSRQHCAFEHSESGDQGWLLVDLASTNGCSVDGERVNGSRALRSGMLVTAGSTSMLVARIADSDSDPEALAKPPLPAPADAWPEQGEAEPPRTSDRLAAVAARSAEESDEFEPQSAPNRATTSDPLIPGQAPPPPRPAPRPAPAAPLDHDILATLPPARLTPAAAQDPAEVGSRTFYINVLGRRVGPLTKAQARELKTKELRGSLTPSDLAVVEAEAALGPIPANQAGGEEQRTYYVTLLGQRVGPLSRSQARDLKAKELRGVLTAEEVERLLPR